MTLTQELRKAFPARYRRKDARCNIYAAVYGPLLRLGNTPNFERQLPEEYSWSGALDVVWNNWSAAQFTSKGAAQIVADFNRNAKGSAKLELKELVR